jgi:hypothetical protein
MSPATSLKRVELSARPSRVQPSILIAARDAWVRHRRERICRAVNSAVARAIKRMMVRPLARYLTDGDLGENQLIGERERRVDAISKDRVAPRIAEEVLELGRGSGRGGQGRTFAEIGCKFLFRGRQKIPLSTHPADMIAVLAIPQATGKADH